MQGNLDKLQLKHRAASTFSSELYSLCRQQINVLTRASTPRADVEQGMQVPSVTVGMGAQYACPMPTRQHTASKKAEAERLFQVPSVTVGVGARYAGPAPTRQESRAEHFMQVPLDSAGAANLPLVLHQKHQQLQCHQQSQGMQCFALTNHQDNALKVQNLTEFSLVRSG